MRKSLKFSPEVIERAVRMVFDAKQAPGGCSDAPTKWERVVRVRSVLRPRVAVRVRREFACVRELLRFVLRAVRAERVVPAPA